MDELVDDLGTFFYDIIYQLFDRGKHTIQTTKGIKTFL